MDSMRSLNSSLPSSRPTRTAPSEDILQAFRSAALSVTNLYKSAATSQTNARLAGYQDALKDILQFLDRENLGLQDGEGWRVRQWATSRYDGVNTHQEDNDREDEQDERESQSREVSQDGEDTAVITAPESTEETTTTPGHESEADEDSDSAEQPAMFQFTSSDQADNSMQTDEASSPQIVGEPSSSSPDAPIRVEVLNRGSRPASRSQYARHNTRPNPREFTFATGTKRKLQFPDFFDISNLNDKRDGPASGGGSKRGRFA